MHKKFDFSEPADVLDRQNAIFELKQKKKQLEFERKRLLEEEERKEGFVIQEFYFKIFKKYFLGHIVVRLLYDLIIVMDL